MNYSNHNILLYQAVNSVNGKRYIGITRRGLEVRRRRHIQTSNSGRGAIIGAALRKHGSDNFNFKTLVVCPDFQYAKEMEIAAIRAFKPEYNITAGGDGAVGFRHSEDHKKRVGEWQRGNQRWLGKSHATETKEKMRLARLKFWASKSHSRKQKVYVKKLVNNRNRAILLEDTDQIFPTVNAAASWSGLDRKTIRYICQGIYKSRKGFRFRYLTDTMSPKETKDA